MATKKQGLQKDVLAIFGDTSLPRDMVDRRPDAETPSPDKMPKTKPPKRAARKTNSKRATVDPAATEAVEEKAPSAAATPIAEPAPEALEPAAEADLAASVVSTDTATMDPPAEAAKEMAESELSVEDIVPEMTELGDPPVEEPVVEEAVVASEPASSEPELAVQSEENDLALELPYDVPAETSVQPEAESKDEAQVLEVSNESEREPSVEVDLSPEGESATVTESPAVEEIETEEVVETVTEQREEDEQAPPAQVIAKPAKISRTPRKPKESPPVGSIAFLEHVKKTMHCPKDFECCRDRFIDICKAKVSGDGKKVICLEGKDCGCRFQQKGFFKRICTCDMRQHIVREYGY